MNNENFNFWKMTFDMGAIDISILRQAVKTDSNPFGEISPEEFKAISGVDFEVKEAKPVETQTISEQPKQTTTVTQSVIQEQPKQTESTQEQPQVTK